MGAGKSSAAMWYVNRSPDRFLYCTPYLSEVSRVLEECKGKRFVEPVTGRSGIGGKKYSLMRLMGERRNVATTHAMFGLMDEEIDRSALADDTLIDYGVIALARAGGYSLVIDEAYDVIQAAGLNERDVEYMISLGLVEVRGGRLFVTDAGFKYEGVAFRGLLDIIRNHTIMTFEFGKYSSLIYPPEMFDAFKDVFVLTYLFEGSIMQSYFDMNDLEYKRIGVRKVDDHYEFFDGETQLPDYVLGIKDKITVCSESRLNSVGRRRSSLSKNWYSKHPDGVDTLRRNLRTFIRRCMTCKEDKSKIMWTTFKQFEGDIKEGYAHKGFVPVGTKATNMYADKSYLAFLVNVFVNPNMKITLAQMGVSVSEDVYALSSLVQWVWRSAIRNGDPINLYIPSRRMRELFIGWLDDVTLKASAQHAELSGQG